MAFPTVGVMASLALSRGWTYSPRSPGIFGDLGHVGDAEAGVRVGPLSFLSLAAGYRVLDVRVEPDDDVAKLNPSGPFPGASLRF